jgi:hypothetical protein
MFNVIVNTNTSSFLIISVKIVGIQVSIKLHGYHPNISVPPIRKRCKTQSKLVVRCTRFSVRTRKCVLRFNDNYFEKNLNAETQYVYVIFDVFTAVTMKNAIFWDIKTQFLLHRRHITSPLQIPAG